LFGYVPVYCGFTIDAYIVAPVPDHAKVVQCVTDDSDEDSRFYYPPPAHRETSRDGKQWRRKPRSRHVPLLFPMPPTHQIAPADGSTHLNSDTFRNGEGGILIHSLAFLHGARAQFSEWWFDGRIPVESREVCGIPDAQLATVMAFFLHTYRQLIPADRPRLINLLSLRNRIQSYYWAWERFAFSYMVFDALYEMCFRYKMIKQAKHHKDRFASFAQAGLICDCSRCRAHTYTFATLRNQLFHESLWHDAPITGDGPGMADVFLPRLLNVLIAQMMRVPCDYVRHCWSSLSSSALGLKPGAHP